jgi:hypothetical protein
MATADVVTAKKRSKKKVAPNNNPKLISWKIEGKVIKVSFIPEAGSSPKEKTMGNMIKPPRNAISRSETAIIPALFTIFSSRM